MGWGNRMPRVSNVEKERTGRSTETRWTKTGFRSKVAVGQGRVGSTWHTMQHRMQDAAGLEYEVSWNGERNEESIGR